MRQEIELPFSVWLFFARLGLAGRTVLIPARPSGWGRLDEVGLRVGANRDSPLLDRRCYELVQLGRAASGPRRRGAVPAIG